MSQAFKERAKEELKQFLILTLYLSLILGSFTVYRRLISDESGISYLHYGAALIQALIVAKVLLMGNMLEMSRSFEEKPLIVPVAYKTIFFGLLVLLFAVLEHLVEGWFHGEGLFGGLQKIREVGAYELLARVLVLTVALIPLFAISEVSRVLGPGKLWAIFFAPRKAETLVS